MKELYNCLVPCQVLSITQHDHFLLIELLVVTLGRKKCTKSQNQSPECMCAANTGQISWHQHLGHANQASLKND